MSLLIACLLISIGDLHYGWYIAAVWIWSLKQFLRVWSAMPHAGDDT